MIFQLLSHRSFFFKYAENKPFYTKLKTSRFIQNNDENRIASWGLPIINPTFLIQQLLDACDWRWLFLRSTQTFQTLKIKNSFLLQFSHDFPLILKNPFDMCDIASNLASNYANTYETIVFTVCEYQNNTLINIIAFVYAIIFGSVGAHHL